MSPLIDAQTLITQLNQDDASWILLDCRFDLANPEAGQAAFNAAHVPGARYAHLDRDLSGPVSATSGRHPLPEWTHFAAQLGEWGINPHSTVVVYDDAGGAFAARAWWLLRWAGHQSVFVLDGGLANWVAEGGQLTDTATAPDTLAPYPVTAPAMALHSATQVLANIDSTECVLVDARAPARFKGEHEPIDPVAGHVPGALNRPFNDNLAPSGRFKSSDTLREEWAALLQGKPCIAMCGSGVTACHHLLAMAHAGLTSGALYAGSWSEWIRDAERPVAVDA